jgi:tetratricopeptide (TPR) repeat protein
MPPDIVYEALHDPWFERSPWGSSTSAKAPPEARKKFENGYRHWNSRDWSKAEYDLREAVRLYPEYARAWDVLGRSLQEQKRFEDANLAFQKAQSSDSDYLPAAIGLLEVNNARGTNALDLAKTCLDWEKKASASTSAAQLKAGAQPLSTPSLAFRLFLRSERLRSLIAVSRAYMVGGDPNRALEVGHEAYLLSPLSLDVAILMTDILIFSHDRDQAKSLLERYLKMPVSRHDKQKARERLQALAQPNGSL